VVNVGDDAKISYVRGVHFTNQIRDGEDKDYAAQEKTKLLLKWLFKSLLAAGQTGDSRTPRRPQVWD
jgi:hypothetical protein